MLFQVTQLMDDYVINDRFRGHDQFPVELDVAATGATAPAGFIGFYNDLSGVKACLCGKLATTGD